MIRRQRPLTTAGLLAALVGSTGAFTTPSSPLTPAAPALGRSSSSALLAATRGPDVVVVSPPGGIGEITSVEAARLGGSVKWFVVSAPSSSSSTSTALTAETLAAIERAGGSMELAGAGADSLLAPPSDDGASSNGALSAMAGWCAEGGGTPSLVCTYDGAFEEKRRVDRSRTPEQLEAAAGIDDEKLIRDAVKVAAREIAGRGGSKIAVLAAGEEMNAGDEEGQDEEGGGFFAGLFGGNEMKVPGSMVGALGRTTSVIRHGELFGAAESSPESSPFVGGPKRDPTVREMYTLRSVRIDPTVSAAGNVLSGGDSSVRSNRLAVGEAASRLSLGKLSSKAGLDVSLSSFAGTSPPTDEEWTAEFSRAASAPTSGAGGSATLFRAEFSSVPSETRLAEWIAVKWAPAVLRSYDIAGTRVGARPVYAAVVGEEKTRVEIVWQELVDFESVTSGRMSIEVDGTGMTATRGPGDAAKGFGRVSKAPLPGEDILVRRLADAASQAVEKGLAVKVQLKKKEAPAKAPVTTVVAVESAAPAKPAPAAGAVSGPGPRGAGARRSAERTRGKRRKASPPPPAAGSDDGKKS